MIGHFVVCVNLRLCILLLLSFMPNIGMFFTVMELPSLIFLPSPDDEKPLSCFTCT